MVIKDRLVYGENTRDEKFPASNFTPQNGTGPLKPRYPVYSAMTKMFVTLAAGTTESSHKLLKFI
jgi:hypothetical protein